MKKIFLSFAVAGLVLMTSCKKEAEKVAEDAKEAVAAGEDVAVADAVVNASSDVPKFSNPDVQAYVEKFSVYSKEMIEASKSGDMTKIQELTAKAQEFSTEAQKLGASMSPEDAKLFADYMMKIQKTATGQ